jgi:hypothetical protein
VIESRALKAIFSDVMNAINGSKLKTKKLRIINLLFVRIVAPFVTLHDLVA